MTINKRTYKTGTQSEAVQVKTVRTGMEATDMEKIGHDGQVQPHGGRSGRKMADTQLAMEIAY